jgi:hypothetical protein
MKNIIEGSVELDSIPVNSGYDLIDIYNHFNSNSIKDIHTKQKIDLEDSVITSLFNLQNDYSRIGAVPYCADITSKWSEALDSPEDYKRYKVVLVKYDGINLYFRKDQTPVNAIYKKKGFSSGLVLQSNNSETSNWNRVLSTYDEIKKMNQAIQTSGNTNLDNMVMLSMNYLINTLTFRNDLKILTPMINIDLMAEKGVSSYPDEQSGYIRFYIKEWPTRDSDIQIAICSPRLIHPSLIKPVDRYKIERILLSDES